VFRLPGKWLGWVLVLLLIIPFPVEEGAVFQRLQELKKESVFCRWQGKTVQRQRMPRFQSRRFRRMDERRRNHPRRWMDNWIIPRLFQSDSL
jgi:hypothetical protein